MPVIAILDGYTLNPGDLSWKPLQDLGDCQIYERTNPGQIYERAKDAGILVVNKLKLDRKILVKLGKLKFICVSATGCNNLDLDALEDLGIVASNVRGYSRESVAQHVFANILSVLNKPHIYHREVRSHSWANCPDFSYWHESIIELKDKVFGIYGFGAIGQYAGQIAKAFGMEVISHHRHPTRDNKEWVEFVALNELFRRSDILSLHAPLTDDNRHVVNEYRLSLMKETAILVNTARGGLIDESALFVHLKFKRIRAACLDVLAKEPPPENHELYSLDNCFITPHQAWASKESRKRLLLGVAENITAFLRGKPVNLITGG